MYRIVVTGSRDWSNRDPIKDTFDRVYAKHGTDVTLINGTARGVDRIAAEVARSLGWQVIDVPADWDQYGRSAGFRRNEQMLRMSPDICIAFWDGQSRGTQHTIRTAEQMGIRTYVVRLI